MWASFWLPVFRAWLIAAPMFAVGFTGAILQLKRLRVQLAQTVAWHKDELARDVQGQLDAQTGDIQGRLNAQTATLMGDE